MLFPISKRKKKGDKTSPPEICVNKSIHTMSAKMSQSSAYDDSH